MTSMNRLTPSGRPILIDGFYNDAYNIHGSLLAPEPNEREAEIAAANDHAAEAFIAYLRGGWTLDIEATEAQSGSIPGRPLQPIEVEMKDGGLFEVRAPLIEIDALGMTIRLGVEAAGRLEVEARLENDRVQYRGVVRDLEIVQSKGEIEGLADFGELLGPLIEHYVKADARPIDLSIEPKDAREQFILADVEVTHVLQRPLPGPSRKALKPKPPLVQQPNEETCWAAAVLSFTDVRDFGNMPSEAKRTAWDHHRSLEAVFYQMGRQGTADRRNYVHPVTRTLTGGEIEELVSAVHRAFFIAGDYEHFDYVSLVLDNIKPKIDHNKYILMIYHLKRWDKRQRADGTKPWHAVVCYGYDDRQKKMMVMDPQDGQYNVVRIEKDGQYFLLSQEASLWKDDGRGTDPLNPWDAPRPKDKK